MSEAKDVSDNGVFGFFFDREIERKLSVVPVIQPVKVSAIILMAFPLISKSPPEKSFQIPALPPVNITVQMKEYVPAIG